MHKRRGSTYVMVLATAMILTVVGMAAIAIRRVRVRSADDTNSFATARRLAFSAAEHATVRINADTNWRSTFSGAAVQQTVNDGAFSWRVIDPVDGDLGDDPSEAATIVATGTHKDASYTLKLEVTVSTGSVLDYAVLGDADVEIKKDKVVLISGASIACNDQVIVKNKAALTGDICAIGSRIEGQAVHNGTVTVLDDPIDMPSASLLNTYKALATTIDIGGSGKGGPKGGGKIEGVLLSPTSNPWGTPNADGVYYINTNGSDLEIKKTRIYGTLIVDTGKGKVKIGGKDGAVLIQNFRSDYPSLIINGKLEVELESASTNLTEADAKTNLNPAGSPYQGEADSDSADSYPNEIHGLVHAFGETKFKKTTILRGAIICADKIKFEGDCQVFYDSALSLNPLVGYGSGGSGGASKVEPGSWARQVD
jgi:hypothetical protein